ncbi:MAG: hypothetical protein ACRDRL_04935, partial [Sciscionella sp.]
SPAFLAPGMLIWGFTAGILTMIFALAGWERPWDAGSPVPLPDAWQRALRRSETPAAGASHPEGAADLEGAARDGRLGA